MSLIDGIEANASGLIVSPVPQGLYWQVVIRDAVGGSSRFGKHHNMATARREAKAIAIKLGAEYRP